MSKGKWAILNTEAKCRCCGKKFDTQSAVAGWGYEYAGKICCSYSCMRKLERKDPNSMVNLMAAEKRMEERREELRKQMRQTEEKPGELREAERQKIVMEYKEGKSITAIAQKHYLNVVAIRDILEQYGVRRRQRGHSASARPGLHEQALRMYERGNSYARIAQELGIHITTARKWIKAAKQQGEDPSLRSGCAREAR